MKQLTAYNIGFALQIFAVIVLFGYPASLSTNGKKDLNTVKINLIIKKNQPQKQ
jgi:hypothetical protein